MGEINQVDEEMGLVGDSADQEKLKDGQLEEVEEKMLTPALAIPTKSRSLRTTSVRKRLEIEVKMAQPKTKGRMSKKARLSKYRRKSANAKERERMKKKKSSSKKKTNSANNKERVVEPKWTHYSKQDLRTKFGGRTPPPPYHLPPSPPPYHLPSIVTTISPPPPYCRTTTTYLCQAPTTIVLPPSPPSCSPSPPSFTTTTTSTVLYTEAELTPNSTSYPPSPPSTGSTVLYSPNPTSYPPSLPSTTSSTTSLYPRPPSSPRDVNEISLHISLIDSQGSYVTAGRPV